MLTRLGAPVLSQDTANVFMPPPTYRTRSLVCGIRLFAIAGLITGLIPAIAAGSGVIKVMPLGDSITHGFASSNSDGYRRPLYLSLTSAGHSVDFVGSLIDGSGDFDRDHEGHGGFRADQIRDNVYNWLAAQDGPSNDDPVRVVLLHIGTNDIAQLQGDATTAVEIGQILDVIDQYETDFSAEITIILARIVNQDNPLTTQGMQVTALNVSIQILADARILAGDDIVVVDMENALDYPGDMVDYLHPNDGGYGKMANAWFPHLNTVLTAICPPVTAPGLTGLSVTSLLTGNFETADLTASYTPSGSTTTTATAWTVDGSPVMAMYLPMEGGEPAALANYAGSGGAFSAKGGNPVWSSSLGYDGNGAYVFDGDDHLDAGEIFPTGSSYTKTAWVYRAGAGGNIISGDTDLSGHAFWAPQGIEGFPNNVLRAGHNGVWNSVEDSPFAPLSSYTWYFVAVTWDASTGQMILYKNGEEIDSATVGAAVADATVQIGAFNGGVQWNGIIDDARIYSRALSAEQLAAMYASGAGDADTIVTAETIPGELWQAHVTPFSTGAAGATAISNEILVLVLPVLEIELLENPTEPNDTGIVFQSLPGLDYQIDTATIFGEWTTLATIAGTGLEIQFIHPGGGSDTKRYYIVRVGKSSP